MKTTRTLVVSLLALLLPVALVGADRPGVAASVVADSFILRALGSLTLDPASAMEIRASSTLHPIHMGVAAARFVLGGSKDLESARAASVSRKDLLAAIVAKQLLSRFSLTIPVDSIRPDEKAMESDLLKTLKADHYPLITSDFELEPPVLLGLIRVADLVDVTFDLKVRLGSG